jgi:hypothetical protein
MTDKEYIQFKIPNIPWTQIPASLKNFWIEYRKYLYNQHNNSMKKK